MDGGEAAKAVYNIHNQALSRSKTLPRTFRATLTEKLTRLGIASVLVEVD